MKPAVTKTIEVICLTIVPLGLLLCAFFQFNQSAVLTAFVAVVALLVFFFGFERSKPSLRQIMPTVVLAALAAAGRVLFAPLPGIKPVSAICIVAGAVFGRQTGFMVGALAALVSNFFFGQGPWTPWQMYAWGMVGYCAGVLADHGMFKHHAVLLVYGFLSALAFGFLLNSWYLVGFIHPLIWESAVLAYGAGLIGDVSHGISTVVFLLAIYLPWQKKLERIKEKYELGVTASQEKPVS